MLGNKVWLTVAVPVHPERDGSSLGRSSVQSNEVLPHQAGKLFLHVLCFA